MKRFIEFHFISNRFLFYFTFSALLRMLQYPKKYAAVFKNMKQAKTKEDLDAHFI